jgi:hypothetical protein
VVIVTVYAVPKANGRAGVNVATSPATVTVPSTGTPPEVTCITLLVMEVESIGSLKVTLIGSSVTTPVALLGGSNTAIVGGTLSGAAAVKLIVTAVLKGFPTRSVMPVVTWAFMMVPTNACSWATGRAMEAVLFASLYTGEVPATGVVTPLLIDVTELVCIK